MSEPEIDQQLTISQTPEGQDAATATAVAEADSPKGDAVQTEGDAPAAGEGKAAGKEGAQSAPAEPEATAWTEGELTALRDWTEYTPEDLAEMPPASAQKVVEKALRSQSKSGRNWSEIGRAKQRTRAETPTLGQEQDGQRDEAKPASQAQDIALDPDEWSPHQQQVLQALLDDRAANRTQRQQAEEETAFQAIDSAIVAMPDAKELGIGDGPGYQLAQGSAELRRRAELADEAMAIMAGHKMHGRPIDPKRAVILAKAVVFESHRPKARARINPTATSRGSGIGSNRAQTVEERAAQALADADKKNPVPFFKD